MAFYFMHDIGGYLIVTKAINGNINVTNEKANAKPG